MNLLYAYTGLSSSLETELHIYEKIHSTRKGEPYRGYEAMNMIRKGQIQGIEKGDVEVTVKFVAQIFGVAASARAN